MSRGLTDKADRGATPPPQPASDDDARRSQPTPPPLPDTGPADESPGAETPHPREDAGIVPRLTVGRLFLSVAPWCISAMFHSILLLVLALFLTVRVSGGDGGTVSLVANPDDDFHDELLDSPFLRDEFELDDSDEAEMDFLSETTTAEQVYREMDVELADDLAVVPMPTEDLLDAFEWQNSEDLVGDITPSREAAASRIQEAGTVEQAVGGLFGNLKADHERGDLLVVWMFDASISLVDDRQRVAREMARFFDEIKSRRTEESHTFMHAAVAFGASARELVPSAHPSDKIIDAVKNVPVDDSGIENVFSAVEWVVKKYGKRWKDDLQIILWGDESGDDLGRLERTIAVCQRRRVAVSVVGPSAVLGRELGTHSWTHAPTGRTFLLPVSRGPDTVHPQRLRLPYWFETAMPTWESSLRAGAGRFFGQGSRLPPWYGGDQLEGLVSGFGPYGLVRLAIETGGSYTIFDRPDDRGPFRVDDMRAYLPDYRGATAVLHDIRYNPLREAVVAAATVTLAYQELQPPEMYFFGRRPRYFSPSEFRERLSSVLPAQQELARRTIGLTERALAEFGPDGMEDLYVDEELPRWRAWYDLTRGRLLAVQARAMEYNAACGMLTQALQPNANYVTFGPSSELRYAQSTEMLVEEGTRLLERCVNNNPDTPWMFLAQRELDHPFGISIRQAAIPEPPPEPPSSSKPPPSRSRDVMITPPRL